MIQSKSLVALMALLFVPVQSIDLQVNSIASVKAAASTIANGMVSYYKGNETGEIPGILPTPYYWWESGAMWDALLQYWSLTGDSQYNSIISQAILFQQGDHSDFMPLNQTKTLGNGEQAMWALAAMSAAETDFVSPAGSVSWLGLAENVFNEQALRWNTGTCGGGLNWQIFPFNQGYTYKNTESNGFFFQLASRLARFTGNDTYSDWAEKVFTWTTSVGLIDDKWNVYDGAQETANCSSPNHSQYSYTAGTYITGAAHMYNITTGDSNKTWKSRLDGLLLNTLSVFTGADGILSEIACEPKGTCNTDMQAFKGILAHWLVDTVLMAPYTSSSIIPKLTVNAQAAAKSCNAGESGAVCPLSWNGTQTNKGIASGVGQQLSALSVVQGLLVNDSSAPKTNGTVTNGGSTGNGTQTSSKTSGSTSPSASETKASKASLGTEVQSMAIVVVALALVSSSM